MIEEGNVLVLRGERWGLSPFSSGDGGTLVETEVFVHDPAFVDQLKGEHRVEVHAGTIGNAADFIGEAWRPPIDTTGNPYVSGIFG